MKLAFVLYRYFAFGGMERNFLNIAKACLANGHDINVFTYCWQGDVPNGFNIIKIPAPGLRNHTRFANFANAAHASWLQHKCDRVIGFQRMPHLDFYYCADVCFRHQSACKHGRWYRLTSRYKTLARFEKMVFEKNSPTQILLLSELQKQFYQQYYHTPDARFHLLPPGIDKRLAQTTQAPNTLREQLGCQDNDCVLLFIGSDYKRKGLDRILQSMAKLKLKHPLQLWIVGQDDDSRYRRFVNKHKLNSVVHFLGPQKNVQPYLQSADVLVHPAYFENTGNVLLEAMISGLAVITTDNCGYAFYIKQADAGVVLDSPFKQEDLTQAFISASAETTRHAWQLNAKTASQQQDFYSRAERAVALIESKQP